MSAAVPEFRTPVMTLVEASWEDQSGTLQTVPARMEDKSAGGACIRVKTPIRVGSKLRIQWRFEQFSGTTRYCRSEGREYLVGIQRHATNSPIPKQSVASQSVPAPPVLIQPVPTQPILIDAPLRKTVSSGDPPVSTIKTQSLSKPQESTPNEIHTVARTVEDAPIMDAAASSTAMPSRGIGHETDHRDSPQSKSSPEFDVPRKTELQSKQLPKGKQAGKERKRMRRKWLGMAPWNNEQGDISASGDGKSNGNGGTASLISDASLSTKKGPLHSAREVPDFHIELPPMEDIYCAAGIMTPRKGYTIKKVVEMINSEHIRGLSKDMKRVALLMALDAAGVPIEEVLRDAKARQDALDSYEIQQKKQVETQWEWKAEEIVQIQAELESIKAHYTARIGRNLEGVAREKATFNGWLTLKQQECQSMSEAVDLCLKSPVSEPASASPPETSAAAPGVQPAAELAKNSISEVSMPKGAGAKPVWFPH